MLGVQKDQSGFALPTILIASVIMLTLLVSAVSAVGSLSASIDAQYYNRLARQAAESGMARATDCLRQSPNYAPGWTDNSPLQPNTDCNGVVISGKSNYISESGNVKTTFQVRLPASGSASSLRVAASGNVYLVRASDPNSVWRAYSQSLAQDSRYDAMPRIAGGSGWQANGHLAAVMTADSQLYAFGDNVGKEITDSGLPAAMTVPEKMVLPAGVNRVTEVKTAGQGGAFICIIGNNAQAYCRGIPGASEDGLLPLAPAFGWQQFVLPAGVSATSMSISGYGPDTMCVLGSDGQAYCAGENADGSLGYGNAAYTIRKISQPVQFSLANAPAGTKLSKIVTQSHITCGITTDGDMYCAGLNNYGQILGPVTTIATPIPYTLPGSGRTVQDVQMTYHTGGAGSLVHVLANDGTIWSSGWYGHGDAGNGTTVGSTGYNGTPVLFTTPQEPYATGSILWNANAGKCIDNNGSSSANGNKIQIWQCSTPQTANLAQMWVYGASKQLTNIGTGKCLDVPGDSSSSVALQLWDCNNTPAQQFDLVGTDTVRHVSSGLCLDIPGAGTANGTIIQTHACNSTPAQSFTRWTGINGWKGMVTGVNHFCGIREDGWSGMWCAGNNSYGQLLNWATAGGSFMGQCQNAPNGGYNYFNVNLPNGEKVDADRLTDEWRQQYNSTMVITTNGKVYGSGRNQFGKLGSDTLGDAGNSFRQCVAQEFALPAGVTAIDMSTRDDFTTYVLASDGKIYASGRNNNGQIGDTTTTDRLAPVEVKIPRQAANY